MGNEQSYIPGIDIVEKAVEVGDYWSQHLAAVINQETATNLTVFIGELFVDESLWTSQTPLEKNGKNIMIYRHPCIVKYVSSWKKNSKFYLAVEEITPLSQVLPKLNTLQISVGIYSVLKALNFLHTNASVSHNNICAASIYVSTDGNWKLAGMEYVCKYTSLNCDYLSKTKSSRYSKGIDPNEEKLLQNKLNRKDFIDVYAFAVLVCEIFKSKSEGNITLLSSFLDFCKNNLQNKDISIRPSFKSILEHEFFNQDYIIIHSFLLELPLKNDHDKTEFFQNLTTKLLEFDEEVVASQLSGLLLSRMVLLNKSAQNNLLPFLLAPHIDEEENSKSIFSESKFKAFICPKLLEIFKVRDVEIRLLLLNYLPNYMHTFTKEELQNRILPELLVGIKDTNDHLVSVTLKTLANLVPILGSATVIGGKRAKLFNDGRPTHPRRSSRNARLEPSHHILSSRTIPETDQISLSSLGNNMNDLPERPRPDGEEGETSTEEVEPSVDDDLDNWEDWEINEAQHSSHELVINDEALVDTHLVRSINSEVDVTQHKTKLQIPDILELDIKNQTVAEKENEFDFFQDMEPVIETSNKFIIDKNEISLDKEFSSKLAVNAADDETNAGWEEEDWE